MSPAKPERLRAVEELCVAQQRTADALMSLAAFEGADLEGALKEMSLAQGRLQAARLAVRRAIVERDGGVVGAAPAAAGTHTAKSSAA